MSALVAEIRKTTTTRMWWITLVCVFFLSAGYAALPATVGLVGAPAGASYADPGILRSIYNGGNPLARTLALVVGIVALAGEYRHRTLAGTYLATPRRLRVLVAKAGSLLFFGLLYGVASVAAGVAVAIPFVVGHRASFQLQSPATWRSLGLGVASVALWTLIGMGIGILIRNLVAAMLVGIGFAFLIEPMLAYVFYRRGWDAALNLLPSGATNAMLGVSSPILFPSAQPLAWWGGLAVLGAWCLVPAILGALVTLRRDVL